MFANVMHRLRRDDNENIWHGDEITGHKRKGHTRFMFHNIRNLTLYGTAGLELFIHEQEKLQVDVQAFSEHCLDTTKFHVTQTAKDILRHTYEGTSILRLDSSAEAAVNQYKPGGTGILALGPISGRLESQGSGGDTLGRWSFIHLRRKNGPPVTIISVYQVCPRPTNVLGNK